MGGPSFNEGLGSPVSLIASHLSRFLSSDSVITSDSFNSYQIREEPPPYSSPAMQRFESFENPLVGRGSQSFGSQDDERVSSGNPQHGTALYDFTAGGDDEVNGLLMIQSGLKVLFFDPRVSHS